MLWAAIVILQALSVLSESTSSEYLSPVVERLYNKVEENDNPKQSDTDVQISKKAEDELSSNLIPSAYMYITLQETNPIKKDCLKCLILHVQQDNIANLCKCLPCAMKIKDKDWSFPLGTLSYFLKFKCNTTKALRSPEMTNDQKRRFVKFMEDYINKNPERNKDNNKKKWKSKNYKLEITMEGDDLNNTFIRPQLEINLRNLGFNDAIKRTPGKPSKSNSRENVYNKSISKEKKNMNPNADRWHLRPLKKFEKDEENVEAPMNAAQNSKNVVKDNLKRVFNNILHNVERVNKESEEEKSAEPPERRSENTNLEPNYNIHRDHNIYKNPYQRPRYLVPKTGSQEGLPIGGSVKLTQALKFGNNFDLRSSGKRVNMNDYVMHSPRSEKKNTKSQENKRILNSKDTEKVKEKSKQKPLLKSETTNEAADKKISDWVIKWHPAGQSTHSKKTIKISETSEDINEEDDVESESDEELAVKDATDENYESLNEKTTNQEIHDSYEDKSDKSKHVDIKDEIREDEDENRTEETTEVDEDESKTEEITEVDEDKDENATKGTSKEEPKDGSKEINVPYQLGEWSKATTVMPEEYNEGLLKTTEEKQDEKENETEETTEWNQYEDENETEETTEGNQEEEEEEEDEIEETTEGNQEEEEEEEDEIEETTEGNQEEEEEEEEDEIEETTEGNQEEEEEEEDEIEETTEGNQYEDENQTEEITERNQDEDENETEETTEGNQEEEEEEEEEDETEETTEGNQEEEEEEENETEETTEGNQDEDENETDKTSEEEEGFKDGLKEFNIPYQLGEWSKATTEMPEEYNEGLLKTTEEKQDEKESETEEITERNQEEEEENETEEITERNQEEEEENETEEITERNQEEEEEEEENEIDETTEKKQDRDEDDTVDRVEEEDEDEEESEETTEKLKDNMKSKTSPKGSTKKSRTITLDITDSIMDSKVDSDDIIDEGKTTEVEKRTIKESTAKPKMESITDGNESRTIREQQRHGSNFRASVVRAATSTPHRLSRVSRKALKRIDNMIGWKILPNVDDLPIGRREIVEESKKARDTQALLIENLKTKPEEMKLREISKILRLNSIPTKQPLRKSSDGDADAEFPIINISMNVYSHSNMDKVVKFLTRLFPNSLDRPH